MSHSSFLSNEPSFYADLPPVEPFTDADAAWFWCVRTSDVIHSGAQVDSSAYPCEAVDIQKVVLRLAQQKVLNDNHVAALVTFGQRQSVPRYLPAAHYWQQAMQHMTPILQRKGIIA